MIKDMTTGNPFKLILLFSIPVVLGNLFQQFYNMADAIIVGRYLGEGALGAVGSTGSLTFLVLGFANGIAQGFGIMISHAFGAKNEKLLKHYVALALILTFLISIILTIPTTVYSKELLQWLNTPADIIHMSDAYLHIIFAGILCTMSYNVAAAILRAIGDSKTPLYFLIFSSILNIFLDIFLIVNIKLGTAGAAYATVISQGLSAVLCFSYMFTKYDVLKTKKADYYFDLQSIKNMLSIGIPMALNYSITAIGCTYLQSAINIFGSTVVASFTAASKVCNIATQPMVSLGTAMSTYCGQNLGAKKYDRIYKGMRAGFILSIFMTIFASVVCLAGGPHMIGLFIKDPTPEVLSYAMTYLHTVVLFALPLAWIFVYRCSLQGLDKGFVPMISGALELVSRYVGVILLSGPLGYLGVCLADTITWPVTALPLMITYFYWKYQTKKQIQMEA